MQGVVSPDAALRRPETEADASFRLRLFGETQGALFAGLDAALADLLLRQQIAAQDAGYRSAHARARFDIVECRGACVGRIVSERGEDAVRLVDVALLPGWRGRGLGTGLITELMEEARAASLPLRLSVFAGNERAQKLYRRLGFRVLAGGDAVTIGMEWRPPRCGARTVPDAS